MWESVQYERLPTRLEEARNAVVHSRGWTRRRLQAIVAFILIALGVSYVFRVRSRSYPSYVLFTEPYQAPTFVRPTPLSFETEENPDTWARRAQRVRQAFQHAFHGYEQHASGYDELLPVTNGSKNNFNGWGVTVFDSLDTMLLMGLDDEFNRSLAVVAATNFTQTKQDKAPFFETVIRYLGGLLSAYALSGEPLLLEKADELATKLSPAFNTTSGLPVFGVNTVTGETNPTVSAYLAEVASCQLEYAYLARATGKMEHWYKAKRVMDVLAQADLTASGGMLPGRMSIKSGQPADAHLSVGAGADSAHEYLLKQYLLTAATDKVSLEMYLRMTTYVLANLTFMTSHRELLYVTDSGYPWKAMSHRLEHLACFFPGLLALGAHTLPLDDLASVGIDYSKLGDKLPKSDQESYAKFSKYNLKDLHMWAANGIAETCWLAYADQASGLGPESIDMRRKDSRKWIDVLEDWRKVGPAGGAAATPPGTRVKTPIVYTKAEHLAPPERPIGRDRDYVNARAEYFLRPETVESMYILWRVTGDVRWRERGWTIFRALEKEARTSSGFAIIKATDESPAPINDSMPSFFLAETLKYLYLLFMDEDLVPLDSWVFNTEAHPLPVFSLS